MLRLLGDAGAGFAGVLAIAGPTEDLTEIAVKWGGAGVVICWFMFRDARREKEMNRLLNKRHEELVELTKDSNEAMSRMSAVAEKCKGKDTGKYKAIE